MRIAVGKSAEANGSEPTLRALQRLRPRRTLYFGADGDVVDRGLPGKQRIGLEQIAGIPVQAGQRLTENPHRPGGGLQQSSGDIEQRRFSASGGADDGDELAMCHRQAGLFYGGVDTVASDTKGHRRIIERDRDRLFGIRHIPPEDWRDALAFCARKFNEALPSPHGALKSLPCRRASCSGTSRPFEAVAWLQAGTRWRCWPSGCG
jgi:hypothetical protein